MSTKKHLSLTTLLLVGIACSEATTPQISRRSTDSRTSGSGSIDGRGVSDPEILKYISEGYDRFTGDPRETCLDLSESDVERTSLRQTESSLDIVDNKSELLKRVAKNKRIGGGISFGIFSIGGSRSSNKVQEIKMKTRDYMAVTELVYRDYSLRLKPYNPGLKADPSEKLNTANNDYFAFRDQCGDMYVKEAIYGSRLLLLVKATTKEDHNYSRSEVSKALKVGLSGLFGGGSIGGDFQNGNGNETRKVLSNFAFETYCITEGAAPATICGNYNIDFSNEQLVNSTVEQFRTARQTFAESVTHAVDQHVRLNVDFGEYTEAKEALERNNRELDTRLDRVNKLFEFTENLKSQCEDMSFAGKECAEASKELDQKLYRS